MLETTHAQQMELWFGPDRHHGSSFASDEARRAIWFKHREQFMAWWAQDDRLPWAFWKNEADPTALAEQCGAFDAV